MNHARRKVEAAEEKDIMSFVCLQKAQGQNKTAQKQTFSLAVVGKEPA